MAATPQSGWNIVHSECSTGWGGQEHRVLAELIGFQQRGSQTRLLAPRDCEVSRRAVAARGDVQPLPVSRLRFPFTVLQVAGWLRRRHAQILNTHSSRDGWLVGMAGRVARVPLLIRTRHIDVDYPHRWLSRHAFTTLADHVLTTSERIARDFRLRFQLPDQRVTAVPSGIDLRRFTPEGPAASLLPDGNPGRWPVVGMVSVLRSWKGHETFLKAVGALRREHFAARYVIVGEGPFRPQIEQWLREWQLQRYVVLAGHHEDVPAVLRGLNLLVIPSTRHEGVPQIGLQALAVRTPVLGSNVGGIPEILQPGQTGRVFPAGNFVALAESIKEALRASGATRAMAERGRALVIADHGLDAMLDRLEALYRRHLSR